MGRKNPGASQPALIAETDIATVLQDAKNTNFDEESSWKEFKEKHAVRLSKKPFSVTTSSSATDDDDEVLHHIAKERLNGYDKFIIWAIQHFPLLLEYKIRGGESPLHTAIRKKNHDFVKLVLEHAEAAMLMEQLTDLRCTCLHLAISSRSPYTEQIIAKAKELYGARKSHTTDNNSSGQKRNSATRPPTGTNKNYNIFTVQVTDDEDKLMTPLHFAMTSDEEDVSVHTTSTTGKPQLDANIRGHAQVDVKTTTNRAVDMPERNLSNTKRPREGVPPLENAQDKNTKDENTKFNLLRIVEMLIEAHPQVLVDYEDGDGDTPFQARLSFLELKAKAAEEAQKEVEFKKGTEVKRVEDPEERRLEIIDKDPVLRYMRRYIIDNFNRRDAMKALYKVGDERVFEFDLSGLPHSKINMEYLNGLGNVLRFEGLLKYVALPRLVVEDDEPFEPVLTTARIENNMERDQISKSKGKGVQHMNSIFRWLKKRHVGSIIKVTVIDDVEPSHSDEAIEQCMKGLDTRVWNWYKVDLCCDVIMNSAQNVEDVTLYSSGKNSVLVGWSSSAGLAKLKRLQRVHIYFQEGLEKPKRLEEYINTFENELKKHKPNIVFTWEIRKEMQNYNSVFTERNLERTTESMWIRTMKDFGGFLKDAKPQDSVKPIKIAVIDDGIDMTLDIFNNKVQVGESFCRLGELTGRPGAYYVPSGPHGTLMAQLICEICPVAKLYVAQLEVLPGQNGRRSFTADSATDAILWAINQRVDIISMSWSIKANTNLQSLEQALQNASNQNIILFCSSIDEGASAIDKTYPGKTGNCIKIGASTWAGTKLSWVSNTKNDFLVPGEALQPTSESSPWSHPNLGSLGSSVSTALAAGLAADLLYCDRLIGTKAIHIKTNRNGISKDREIDRLRESKKMEEAFTYLAKGTEENKFLQVWDYLILGPEKLVFNEKSFPDETRQTREKLKGLMDRLHG